jgi:hypothetical protein
VKVDEVDVLAAPVLGHLHQIVDVAEPALARELRRDIIEGDRHDRVDLDLAVFEGVAFARRHPRTNPHPDAAGDRAAADSIAQIFRE